MYRVKQALECIHLLRPSSGANVDRKAYVHGPIKKEMGLVVVSWSLQRERVSVRW